MNRFALLRLVILTIAVTSFASTIVFGEASEEDLAKVRAKLEEMGNPWTANMSPMVDLPGEVVCGDLEPDESAIGPNLNQGGYRPMDLPAHFDWRDNGGNWVTPVRSQGSCGSCWDFAATAAVESGTIIKHNREGCDYNLSEQHILSCSGAGSCSGGYTYLALSYYIAAGSPDEDCFPYAASDLPCADTCSDWSSRAQKIESWSWVTTTSEDVNLIKQAVHQYPVATHLDVYEDFYYYYDGGIYEYAYGDYLGGHAVVIVGWDDDEKYWIVKNSWGAGWAESGYFRIRWGQTCVKFGTWTLEIEPGDTLTYIDLNSFDAEAQGSDIILAWETGAEIDNAGFVIYRTADSGQSYEMVSGFIQAEGTPGSGDSYTFVDEDASPGVTYCYYLVDVDTAGKWAAHGPACARVEFERLNLRPVNAGVVAMR
ncbi:hypothetical protein J7M28_13340 [bacterium]|nr:hypothetical protein [bacterium]